MEQRDRVMLDAAGEGDVTTLAEALALSAENGLIRILPGTYEMGGIVIDKPVTIYGTRDETGARAVLRGQITVIEGEISLERLNITAAKGQSALHVAGGAVSLDDVTITDDPMANRYARSPATVLISVNAGKLDIVSSRVSASAGAALASLRGRVSIATSQIIGDTVAADARDGTLSITDSDLHADMSVFVSDGALVSLVRNRIYSTNDFETFGVAAKARANVTLTDNVFFNYDTWSWYCEDPTVTSMLRGNTNGQTAFSKVPYCPDR